jgi:BirA family biotin operon repressor/biotin-[acetyl-CoA-carboxylase] ligase
MDIDALRFALRNSPVSGLRAFAEIGSTNDEALQWVDAGAPDFALVIADRQTHGRGRLNRQWITRPEASLAFSVILRPSGQEATTPSALFAPMCGLAVWQALHDDCGLEAQIKWPNDILLNREKCCGILVEAAWSGNQLNGIVLGIGINLTAESLPTDAVTRFPATWVEKHTSHPVVRFDLLAKILETLQYWRMNLGTPAFFSTWQDHLAFKGETVSIVENEISSIIGIEEGIDPTGNLILQDTAGDRVAITVGDVSLRTSQ